MATIDIGKIKPVFKGAYNNSTAYVLDDIVYYNGSSYVAKQSTTGNVPTNGTYWEVLASGSGGIWDANLSIGSASQKLRVNSGGTALEFFTEPAVTTDFVKLAGGNVTSGNNFNINGYFTNTYDVFKLYTWGRTAWHKLRFNFGGSYTTYTSSNYVWVVDYEVVGFGHGLVEGDGMLVLY